MTDTKKKEETAVAPAAPAGALMKFEDMVTLDRPAGKDEGELGTEGITRDDILMPRIGLAQKMSKEIDASETSRYIQGLTFMDMWNTDSKKVYGRGPLHFVILKQDDPRWIEFNPLEDGGGIKDRNVLAGDPRTKFGPDGEKPIATKFLDLVILVLNDLDPADVLKNVAVLSLKGSGLKAARHLNLLIVQRGPKIISKGVYSATTDSERDPKSGSNYAIFKFKNAGWLKAGSPLEAICLEMWEAWKNIEVKVEREPGDEDFDPKDLEAQAPVGAPGM